MKNNKKVLSICTLLTSLLLTSCNNAKINIDIVEDTNLIKYFNNIDLRYDSFMTPGSQLSYMILFKGYDPNNLFGPRISKEERYHTYLVNYDFKNDTKYYFIYFKNSNLDTFIEYYNKNSMAEISFSNFGSDKNIIDSKYLYISNCLEMTDYRIYEGSSLDDCIYNIDDYFLGGIFESRNVTIKEDVSLNETINKEVPLLHKLIYKYDEKSRKISEYSDKYLEDNITSDTQYFNMNGSKFEVYPSSFASLDYLNIPFFGNDQLYTRYRVPTQDDKISLPRYFKNNASVKTDLLDETYVYNIFEEDVYGDLKKEFKDAFISLEEDSNYGYFDLNKVKEIIHKHSND